jgi:hypothetical protein
MLAILIRNELVEIIEISFGNADAVRDRKFAIESYLVRLSVNWAILFGRRSSSFSVMAASFARCNSLNGYSSCAFLNCLILSENPNPRTPVRIR